MDLEDVRRLKFYLCVKTVVQSCFQRGYFVNWVELVI